MPKVFSTHDFRENKCLLTAKFPQICLWFVANKFCSQDLYSSTTHLPLKMKVLLENSSACLILIVVTDKVHVFYLWHFLDWVKFSSRKWNCSFSVDPKRSVKLQNFKILRSFLGSFRKSSAIVGSSSETLALGRKKISRLWLRKSWQVYIHCV